MLQHNAAAGRKTHLLHAAVVGIHALCCGLPVLALLAVGISGAAASAVGFSHGVGAMHAFLHAYELWVLALSGVLVAMGAAFETSARLRSKGPFPWLFAASAACFLINLAIIFGHRAV